MRYLKSRVYLLPAIFLVLTVLIRAEASVGGYKAYGNDQYGFGFDIPAHWVSEINDYSLVFSGPKGGEEWNTTINVQIIKKGDYTLASLARALYEQWQGSELFQEHAREEGSYGGGQAVRYQVTYRRENDTVMFAQDQLVIEGPEYFYLLGYTAPQSLYRKHYDKMVRAVTSFLITGLTSGKSASP
jgi:hypothetical protein